MVLEESRNPSWPTKMAAAKKDDTIPAPSDVINSFCGPTKFHCRSLHAVEVLKGADSQAQKRQKCPRQKGNSMPLKFYIQSSEDLEK